MSTDYLLHIHVSGVSRDTLDYAKALRALDDERGAVRWVHVHRWDSGGSSIHAGTTVGLPGYVIGHHGTERALAEHALRILRKASPGARCIEVRVVEIENLDWFSVTDPPEE
jgi:hypothetical protein